MKIMKKASIQPHLSGVFSCGALIKKYVFSSVFYVAYERLATAMPIEIYL
jgi:hypothetical protein